MKFIYHVEYHPHPKADMDEWDVVMEAENELAAMTEMQRRYPAYVEPNGSYHFVGGPEYIRPIRTPNGDVIGGYTRRVPSSAIHL